MRKIEAVRRRVVPKTSGLPAVLVAAAIAAACGGPAAVLHDVLDEAEDRVDFVLDVFDDTEDEMNEAAATELPPCPVEYEPPPLWEGPPPYEDAVERPAELPDTADQNDILSTHRAACRDSGPLLLAMPGVRDQLRPQLEDFSDFAEAMRNFIDDDMTDEQIETLSAEVDAVARARPDAEDTLELRYERLLDRMLDLSSLVREMARGARRPGAFVNPGAIPYPEAGDDLAEFTEPWTAVMEAHAEAQGLLRSLEQLSPPDLRGTRHRRPRRSRGGLDTADRCLDRRIRPVAHVRPGESRQGANHLRSGRYGHFVLPGLELRRSDRVDVDIGSLWESDAVPRDSEQGKREVRRQRDRDARSHGGKTDCVSIGQASESPQAT